MFPRCPKPPLFLQNEIWEASSLFFRKHFPDNPFSYLQCADYSAILFVILVAKFDGAFRDDTYETCFIKIGDKERALRLKEKKEDGANHYYLEFDGILIDPTWKQFVHFKDDQNKAEMEEPHNQHLYKSYPDIMIGDSEKMRSLVVGFATIMPASRRKRRERVLSRQYFWKNGQDETSLLFIWLRDGHLAFEGYWKDIQRITGARDPTFESFYERLYGVPLAIIPSSKNVYARRSALEAY